MKSTSLHKIDNLEAIPFEAKDYSRFKYGCKITTNMFAEEMTELVIDRIKEAMIVNGSIQNIYIYGAPYNVIPTASTVLATQVFNKVQSYFKTVNIYYSKIYRQHSYSQDYSAMSKEDRDKSLSKESHRFQYPDVELLDKTDYLIFIDDIKITGSHEERIQHLCDKSGLVCGYESIYFAELVNQNIGPEIEDVLNQSAFAEDTFLYFLISGIARNNITYNTRLIKRILSLDSKAFNSLIIALKQHQLVEMMDTAEANSYCSHEDYKENCITLKKALSYES